MKENKISSDEWSWLIYGRRISLTWSELQIPELMKNYFKIFLFNQSKNKSPATLENQEIFFIKKFGKSLDLIENSTPITIADWITIIDDLISGGYANNMYYSIRSFVKFSQSREIDIPYDEILNYLLSFKGSFNNLPYQKIFLNQHHVDYEYLRIIREYTIWNKSESHSILTKKLIVLLSLEIAPRASQLYLLDSDRIIKHSTDYYSLSLPLVKKKLTRNNEYRNRRISKHLGELIDEVLFRNRTILNQKKSVPLIISSKH